jgi:hypothetical protein
MTAWSSWRQWTRPPDAPRAWSRRAFLGGGAAMVTLPFLPSLLPRGARADGAPPVRLMWWFCPNGMNMPDFTPLGVDRAWELTPILEPLATVRSEITVISGLANLGMLETLGGPHPAGTATFLSADRITVGAARSAQTVDQLIATALGQTNRFPSLQLKLSDGRVSCEPGYPCAYYESISWADPITPLAPLSEPAVIFDRLFAGLSPGLSEADRARRALVHGSILDAVTEDAASIKLRLSAVDQLRMDSFLTSVRELEQRVEAVDARVCPPAQRPGALTTDDARMDALLDLIVLAFECDLTRYISFMLGNGGSVREYSALGTVGAHHWISHHSGDPEKLAALTTIDRWEVAMYAELVDRLRRVPEANGSLLDNTLLMLGSECSDGNLHNHDDLPVLLAGRGGGAVDPGRHLVYDGNGHGELYLSMLAAAGLDVSSIGVGASRPLPGLLL